MLAHGTDGLFAATRESYDVLVVDRMIPGLDGLSLVQALRAAGRKTPMLFLTALGGIDDRVEGLEAGGDDYLTKPFAFAGLLARVNALARRPPVQEVKTVLRVADLELVLPRRQSTRGGQPIDLLPKEFTLLEVLMRNDGRVVMRTMLLERVWEFHFDPKTSELLTQAFANLIENAIRHCPTGTVITCKVRAEGNRVTVSASDTGPGIPAGERALVFRRLYRLEKSRTTEGAGLGLSLVKAVADLYGAELALADATPGLRVELRFTRIIGAS